jgi:hypothetical protein
MTDFYNFPGAFVWKYQVPESERINLRLSEFINKEASEHAEDEQYSWERTSKPTVITSYWQPDESLLPLKDDIDAVVYGSVKQLIISLEGKINLAPSYRLHGLWWNRYPPGTYAPAHCHGSSAISAAYVVEQDEDCPLTFMCQNHYSINPSDSGYRYEVSAEPGTCVMFPSSLVHWTTPAKSWRSTLSFNFMASSFN